MLFIGRPQSFKAILDSLAWTAVPAEKIGDFHRFTDHCARGTAVQSMPRAWFDEAMQTFRELEYRALGLPVEVAPYILEGAKAAGSNDLKGAFDNYRTALQQASMLPLFGSPLRDKTAFLQSDDRQLGASVTPSDSRLYHRKENPARYFAALQTGRI